MIGASPGTITSPGLVVASYAVGALLMVGALATVLLRNLLYATGALVATLVLAGLLYLVLDAGPLLVAVQIVLYGGGAGALLYVFSRWTRTAGPGSLFNRQLIPAAIVALAVALMLASVPVLVSWPPTAAQSTGDLWSSLTNLFPVAMATAGTIVAAAAVGLALLLTRRIPRAATAEPAAGRGRRRRTRPDARA